MLKFYIEYRGEFAAEIEADSRAEAIKKFAEGDCEIEVVGTLHCQHFQVSELHSLKRG